MDSRITALIALAAAVVSASPTDAAATKQTGVLFADALVRRARANATRYPWAAAIRDHIIESAKPWMRLSDEDLWGLMFGNTIRRSWMVWSNGYCPSCKRSVPMYTWVMDALAHPWKTQCPHCREWFPKNDFALYYRSGLDEHGVYDPRRADRALLYNVEHPSSSDPLHTFGVDDGEGYIADGHRWRFIGAYLIYGQWKQAILGGINSLAAAYAVTGDAAYAHRAGILLDRVADIYPTMDFGKEGVMYEGPPRSGYVSTWHDACEETRQLAISYDQVFDGLKRDPTLPAFLSAKASEVGLANPKRTFSDVQRNIEDRILRDALNSPEKIYSNYPQTDVTRAIIETVLGWPGNRERVYGMIEAILKKATAVDGVTGEKGLAGYAAYGVQGTARLLAQFARLDPSFLRDALQRVPAIHDLLRFHIDTWIDERYYPEIGDTGEFARPVQQYAGVAFARDPGISPSMFTLLWDLYSLTHDAALVQVLFHGNGDSVEGLPRDLAAPDPPAIQRAVERIIADNGASPRVGSVNKQQWHLAILRQSRRWGGRAFGRSGPGRPNPPDARTQERPLPAVWLCYDSGGGHGHANGMNLGLFAYGLDLMPDLGYPPVQFGGWGAPRATWYTMTAAHNTVVVDGQDQPPFAGKTTLWADGESLHVVRATAPDTIPGLRQYERTAAMVAVPGDACYVLDVFRVVGGRDHARFMHSGFGTLMADGLSLSPAQQYGHDTQMRGLRLDPSPRSGWSADWKLEDPYHMAHPEADVHLRYTDLTHEAESGTCEAWISVGGYNADGETWIPRLLTRRHARNGTLESTFAGILEPYDGRPKVNGIHPLALLDSAGAPLPESCVGVRIDSRNQTDILLARDVEDPLHRVAGGLMRDKDSGLQFDGDLCLVRRGPQGAVTRVALCNGRSLSAGGLDVRLTPRSTFVEIAFEGGGARILAGTVAQVESVRLNGKPLRITAR